MSRHRFKQSHSHRTRPALLRRTVCTITPTYKIIQLVDHSHQEYDDPYLSITTERKEIKVYTTDAILNRVKEDLPLEEYLVAEKFFMERV